MSVCVITGDCLEVMSGMEANSVDAIVTDPPAGINFMGKTWDHDKGGRDQWIAWMQTVAAECLRVLKPGGHALVWALPRTSHWTATAWENAGFQVRDRVVHLFGSGFAKSLDVSKAIDKAAGAERERIRGVRSGVVGSTFAQDAWSKEFKDSVLSSEPLTEAARQWQGWGTALKPAAEDFWLLRKPFPKGYTVAQNVLEFGVGGLNIDASRVKTEDQERAASAYRRLSSLDSSAEILASSASQLRGYLRRIASALRSCSTGDKALLRGVCAQDGSSIDPELCEILSARLFPNGAWCGGSAWSIPDSLSGCPACRRCSDEHIRFLREAAQDGPTSLAGALDRICSGQYAPEHNHGCQCNGRPSNSGEALLAWSFAFLCGEHCTLYSTRPQDQSRWPANVTHDGSDEVLAAFPQTQTNANTSGAGSYDGTSETTYGKFPPRPARGQPTERGSAARFFHNTREGESRVFYTAKASSFDRNDGTYDLPQAIVNITEGHGRGSINTSKGDGTGERVNRPRGNHHATVKSTELMRWLCRLITPPGGLILDPFCGSGSTLKAAEIEGFSAIGIELDPAFCEIARRRIASDMPLFAEIAALTEEALSNSASETLWCSPHCVPAQVLQFDLFADA